MQLTRTTIRLEPSVKKAAEKRAMEEESTFQDLVHRALKHYLDRTARQKAERIVFHTQNLGKPLDNLTRSDYYPHP